MRLEKLEKIKKAGIDPYPAKSKRTHTAKQTLDNFDNLLKSEKEITLAGRIMAIRGHGGSTFVNIEDGSGKIQVYFKKDELGNEITDFNRDMNLEERNYYGREFDETR